MKNHTKKTNQSKLFIYYFYIDFKPPIKMFNLNFSLLH